MGPGHQSSSCSYVLRIDCHSLAQQAAGTTAWGPATRLLDWSLCLETHHLMCAMLRMLLTLLLQALPQAMTAVDTPTSWPATLHWYTSSDPASSLVNNTDTSPQLPCRCCCCNCCKLQLQQPVHWSLPTYTSSAPAPSPLPLLMTLSSALL